MGQGIPPTPGSLSTTHELTTQEISRETWVGASTSLNKGASALSPHLAGTCLAPAWPPGVTWPPEA